MQFKQLFRKVTVIGTIIILLASCGNNNEPETEAKNTNDITDVKENNGTVNAYVGLINADTAKMTLDHSFTKNALMQLTAAVDAMAKETDFNVKADLDRVKELAAKITEDPLDISHADTIKMATGMLATALQNMQKAKYASLSTNANDVVKASEAIDPDKLTLNQRDAVQNFFAKASELLEKMN